MVDFPDPESPVNHLDGRTKTRAYHVCPMFNRNFFRAEATWIPENLLITIV